MLVKLKTYSLRGIEAVPVEVEVDVSRRGKDGVTIVGLPETVVKESTHRVSRAIENSGYTVPSHSILVNLAPADMPKQAASFDVPIARVGWEDGCKVYLEDGSWLILRFSGTEPRVRVFAEAATMERAAALVGVMAEYLGLPF